MTEKLIKAVQILKIAFRCLLIHKLRSTLSSLGVVCGVMAVLSMISIGEGAKQKVIEKIEQLGTKNIYIKAIPLTEDQKLTARERLSKGLTFKDLQRIRVGGRYAREVASLKELAASILGMVKEVTPQIVASSSNYANLQNFFISKGRFISDQDVDRRNLVCVLGDKIAGELGPTGEVGSRIRIANHMFKVVGILDRFDLKKDESSAAPIRNYNEMIFIPLGTERVLTRQTEGKTRHSVPELSEIVIQMNKTEQVLTAAGVIKRIMEVSHNNVDDYQIIVPLELLQQVRRTQRTFNMVLGAIAGISLLVGGIGIMNIMLATVSERTKEIGIRRAVGATRGNIVMRFLLETVILTSSGGIVGILLGMIAARFIATVAEWNTAITSWAVAIPLAMSIFVGIFFGLYPAYRAAKMDPVNAFRHG